MAPETMPATGKEFLEKFSDFRYHANVEKHWYGWSVHVTGCGLGSFEMGPTFRRRTRATAMAAAQRWCKRDAEKRSPERVQIDV